MHVSLTTNFCESLPSILWKKMAVSILVSRIGVFGKGSEEVWKPTFVHLEYEEAAPTQQPPSSLTL